MAPELIRKHNYTTKVDVWSLGIIVYQLLSGRTPFEANSVSDIQKRILREKIDFKEMEWEFISENAKDFITTCLEKDP